MQEGRLAIFRMAICTEINFMLQSSKIRTFEKVVRKSLLKLVLSSVENCIGVIKIPLITVVHIYRVTMDIYSLTGLAVASNDCNLLYELKSYVWTCVVYPKTPCQPDALRSIKSFVG
jgi:hypothetical protein